MRFRRGFKTEANELTAEVRRDLGLGPYGRLNPLDLAHSLDVPVVPLSDFLQEAPIIRHLLVAEPEAFSAVTVFAGRRRTIVHNDAHAVTRQNSNLAHELAHALLHHPPTPALDDRGCREWDDTIEGEASWLAGCLLVPEGAAMAIAKGRWGTASAALRFGVSPAMIRYRLNGTGALRRVERSLSVRRDRQASSAR